MPPSRCIKLTEEQDNHLREIEQDSYLKPKVRLRAQVLRLSNRGSNIRAIASYTGRSRASIARDLDRFRRRGLEGLADGTAPGNPPRITQKARRYIEERLTEERTWNATQLAEALKEEFSVVVSPEAVRQHLHSMGYTWKRTRYVPNKAPDPDAEREAKERLEYRMLEGSCESGEVLGYLDALAHNAEQEHKPCVVVLDNAPFHTAGVVREREEDWEARGLTLYRLPAYCPQLNLIEGVWRRLKGFLMPRRFYDSVAELKQAVLHGLRLLEAVEIHCSLGDT